jgi:Fur family ferric uptake transcriptional regulator
MFSYDGGVAERAGSWSEHATRQLAAAGRRRGGARNAVIDVLAQEGCALSAFEIEERLAGAPRKAGRASVYRVLEELERLDLVSRVEVGHGIARFELVDPEGAHHHHFVCERCGELSPFEDDELERVIHRVADRLQFEVGDHDITLRGACVNCRDRER